MGISMGQIPPEIRDRMLQDMEDLDFDSSPCIFCKSIIGWGDRFCMFCGESNENYNPDHDELMAEVCDIHNGTVDLGAGPKDPDFAPYCGYCGLDIRL